MAKKSFKEKFNEFISDRKKLTLLLLLLGGGGVVTTSVALLASNPNSSQPNGSSVSTSITGSSGVTTSTAGSSAPLTSLDGELPDLNLDNATINFESDGGLSFGFDRVWGNFYKQNYLYQIGINYFDGVTEETANSWNKGFVGFVVYNFETNVIEFEFTFNPGQTYIDAVMNDGVNPVYTTGYSSMEIYDGYLYVLSDYVQFQSNELVLGGDYQPIIDFLETEGISYRNTNFNMLLRFDLAQPGDYEVVFLESNNFYSTVTSITFHNDELHVLANNRNQANNNVSEHISFFDPFTLPETVIANEYYVSYTIHPMTDGLTIGKQRYQTFFETESTNSISYVNYGRFTAISEGLVYTNFDENGNPFISLNTYLNSNSLITINNVSESIDALQAIQGVSANDLSNIKGSLNAFYDEIRGDEYVEETTSIYVQFSYMGLFSLEADEFEFAIHTNSWLNFYWTDNLNEDYYFQSSIYTSLVKVLDSYFLTSTFTQYVYPQITQNGSNIYDNEGTIIVDYFTTIKQFDSVNKTFTNIDVPRDDLYNIAGLYPRDGGYYLSSTIIENDTNGVKGLAAALFLLDENFEVEDSLILDGSKTDFANILTINSSGRIIWIIYSSSIDEDFEGAATVNTGYSIKQYAVFF